MKQLQEYDEMMKKCFIFTMLFLGLSPLIGEITDRNYTEDEFQNSTGAGAVFSVADVLKLISYKEGHGGNFYDYALQGLFRDAVWNSKRPYNLNVPQLEIIHELCEKEMSKQDFRETLEGLKNLLTQENRKYSPCVIAFCLIVDIMEHKKELKSSDIDFFLDYYQKTDNKIIQHAIYTAILNGKNAIEHKEIIFKHGSYLDVSYLLMSLIRTTHGDEQEAWKKQLQMLKEKSPVLEKSINSFLGD